MHKARRDEHDDRMKHKRDYFDDFYNPEEDEEGNIMFHRVKHMKHRSKRAEGGKMWIKSAIKHPGALHEALHVPEDEKISAKKMKGAMHSDNPTIRKEANLAKTLKSFHH